MQNDKTNNTEAKVTFGQRLLMQKFSNPFVLVFLALAVVFISLIVYKLGIIGFGAIVVITFGLPILFGIVAYPQFGITVLIITSFFINYVSEFLPDAVPIGTLLDAITYLLILGFFIK